MCWLIVSCVRGYEVGFGKCLVVSELPLGVFRGSALAHDDAQLGTEHRTNCNAALSFAQ